MAHPGDITCSQCGDSHPEDTKICPRTELFVDGGPCGKQIDRYVVERFVAGGGMGAVYRARHALLAQPVALKLLKPQFAKSPDILERFTREARAAAAIGNPHIIRVTDVGVGDGGQPFLVMELLEGQDLESLLRERGRLPITRALDIGLQILDGLGAAHAANIVHRDLKPANVFLAKTNGAAGSPRDFVKLLDFGISKMEVEERVSTLTKTGMVMGTPQYMAPEQFMGAHAVDARADLYSAAVTIYQMLTGTLPFDAQSYERLVIQVCTEAPKPLRTVAPEVPEAIATVIERAMAREPEGRPATAQALAVALRQAAPHVTASFAPIAFAQPQTSPTPRTRALSASDPPPASPAAPDFGSWPSVASASGSSSPARPLVAPWPSVAEGPRTPLGGLSAPVQQTPAYSAGAPATPLGVYAPTGIAPSVAPGGPVTPYAVEAVALPGVGALPSASPPAMSGPGSVSAVPRTGATPAHAGQGALPRTGGQQSYPQAGPASGASALQPLTPQAYAPQPYAAAYPSTVRVQSARAGRAFVILAVAFAFTALAGAAITAAYVFTRHRTGADVAAGTGGLGAFAAAQPPTSAPHPTGIGGLGPTRPGSAATPATSRGAAAGPVAPAGAQTATSTNVAAGTQDTAHATPGAAPPAPGVSLTPMGPPQGENGEQDPPADPEAVSPTSAPRTPAVDPAASTSAPEVDVDFGPITHVGAGSLPLPQVRQALRQAIPQIAMCGRHDRPLDRVRVIVIVQPNGDLFAPHPDPTVAGGSSEFAECVAGAIEELGHIPPGPNTDNLIAEIDVHMRWHR